MKKSLFLLSILASCFGAFGQLTNNSFDLESYYGDLMMRRYVSGDLVWKRALVSGTNQLIVNYAGDYTTGARIMGPQLLVDGNVGIGSTNPKAKLSIFGGNGFFTNPTLELKSDSNKFAWALLQLKGGSFDDKADYMIGRGTPDYNEGRALTFHIPSRKDFYNGSGKLPQISFVSSGANTLGYVQAETGNWYMKGNVGIGTTSPGTKLEVNGDILLRNHTGLKQIYTWHPTDRNWRIGMNATPGFTRSMTTAHVQFLTYAGGATQGFAVGVNRGNSSLEIRGSDHTAFFRGNVGIGTTTPDAKLAVNGNIHAKEVTVDLVGWPDYVFENTYKLPTLQQVENHIQDKGHLINIPSAAEVAKKGIQLGEMNKKLLEKIEELTLYTIAQEKKLQKQEERLAKLEVLVLKK